MKKPWKALTEGRQHIARRRENRIFRPSLGRMGEHSEKHATEREIEALAIKKPITYGRERKLPCKKQGTERRNNDPASKT